MGLKVNLDKTISAISKISVSHLTTFFTFISSFNMWFLAIYFLSPSFIKQQGLTITLMTTFALTITWYLFYVMIVPKDFLLYCFVSDNPEWADQVDNNRQFNIFIFADTLISFSLFLYLSYWFHWKLFTLVSVSFLSTGIRYFLSDILLKLVYDRHQKGE